MNHPTGLAYSSLPQLVHAHCKHILTTSTPTRRGAELFPHQLIANKTVRKKPTPSTVRLHASLFQKKAVEPHAPPRYTLRQDRYAATAQSWLNWAESREVEEWIHSVAGVLDQGWNDQFVARPHFFAPHILPLTPNG
jgi:actin-like protein 6B